MRVTGRFAQQLGAKQQRGGVPGSQGESTAYCLGRLGLFSPPPPQSSDVDPKFGIIGCRGGERLVERPPGSRKITLSHPQAAEHMRTVTRHVGSEFPACQPTFGLAEVTLLQFGFPEPGRE